MRRNDALRSPRRVSWLLLGAASTVLALSSTMAWADQASDTCRDQRVRQAAAESIGKWAQFYPFARILIGTDARFGYVSEAIVQQRGDDNIVCLASYHLSVSIDHFAYRVTSEADGLTVSLADLPPTLDGTGLSMEDLIARFSVNGQPYADVLRANQQRIKERNR
jgi:hypothetical protein